MNPRPEVDTRVVRSSEFRDTGHGLLIVGAEPVKAFGPLVALVNDDLHHGSTFPPHHHSGIEIVTYPLQGSMTEEDSTGQRVTLGKGDLGYHMSGRGITHGASVGVEGYRGLQMWMSLPKGHGNAPPLSRVIPSSEIPEKKTDPATSRLLTGKGGAIQLLSGVHVSDVKLSGIANFSPWMGSLLAVVIEGNGEFSVGGKTINLGLQDIFVAQGEMVDMKVKSVNEKVRFILYEINRIGEETV